MRDNLTHITVVLDESGSMYSLQKDTIGGVNSFIQRQSEAPGEAKLTLLKFNSDLVYLYTNVDIKDVPALKTEDYTPNGGTALLRAAESAIDSTGRYLASLDETDRPSKVIVLIVTDGEENASRYPYTPQRLKQKINHQRDAYQWEFVFLGANQDAITAGAQYGFQKTHSMGYGTTSKGVHNLFQTLSANVVKTRGVGGSACGVMSFSQADRALNDPNATATIQAP